MEAKEPWWKDLAHSRLPRVIVIIFCLGHVPFHFYHFNWRDRIPGSWLLWRMGSGLWRSSGWWISIDGGFGRSVLGCRCNDDHGFAQGYSRLVCSQRNDALGEPCQGRIWSNHRCRRFVCPIECLRSSPTILPVLQDSERIRTRGSVSLVSLDEFSSTILLYGGFHDTLLLHRMPAATCGLFGSEGKDSIQAIFQGTGLLLLFVTRDQVE